MASGNGKDLSDAELLAATLELKNRTANERAVPAAPDDHPPRSRRRTLAIHGTLYVATICTTWLAGGPLFSLTLMAILTFHEGGHYYFAMRHRVPASLPYFVPFPLSLFGTMGAVIAMPARIPHRRALLDIGAAGPIAGFLLAVPALALGMHWSKILPVPAVTGDWVFGDNLLVKILGHLVGPANPHDEVVQLHPVGFAGYVGCLVTAFNLIPVGQLDGGHVLQALLGRRAIPRLLERSRELRSRALEPEAPYAVGPIDRAVSAVRRAMLGRAARFAAFTGASIPRAVGASIVTLLFVLGVTTGWKGWLLWVALLLFLGVDHPPTLDEREPLDRPRAALAFVCLAILVLTFVPVPVSQLP